MSVTLDIFQPRVMLAAVMQMKRPQRFLLDNFFQNVRQFDTLSVDIDIFKDKRRIAPFSNPLHEGKVVDSLGYVTKNFVPPYTKPKMRTTAQELLKRVPGEHVYFPINPEDRAAQKLGEDLAMLDDMITRREEWMAFRGLQDGQLTVVGDGVSRTIDFEYDASHLVTLGGTDVWDDADSDPIQDLLFWRRMVLRDSGIAPTDCVLGNDAAEVFLNHAKVKDWFNRWNFIPGQITVEAVGNVIEYGFIPALGMRLYTVNEWFIDPDDGLEKEMLDAKRVLLLSRGARTARYYGAIQVVGGVMATSRYPKTWEVEDPSVRWVQMHSAPLPAPEQPDGFLSAQVLA